MSEKEIIRINQSLTYLFAKELLLILHSYDCYNDKHFKELLTSLERYIYSQIVFPDGLEIVNEYAVFECIKI